MKRYFFDKLEKLRKDCYLQIGNMSQLKGKKSKHNNSIVIPVPTDDIYISVVDDRYITEIGSVLIDNSGYQYSLGMLDVVDLVKLTDFVTNY